LQADLRGSPAALDKFLRALEAELEKEAGRLVAGVRGPREPAGKEPVWGFSLLYTQGGAQGWVRARVQDLGSKRPDALVLRMEEDVSTAGYPSV
jgi:hypothetical protein